MNRSMDIRGGRLLCSIVFPSIPTEPTPILSYVAFPATNRGKATSMTNGNTGPFEALGQKTNLRSTFTSKSSIECFDTRQRSQVGLDNNRAKRLYEIVTS